MTRSVLLCSELPQWQHFVCCVYSLIDATIFVEIAHTFEVKIIFISWKFN